MENNLKEYFDYRGQVIKDNWNDEYVKYSSSFLRGPINGPKEICKNNKPDNYEFLVIDVFITEKDKEKIFVYNHYHLDTNKYDLEIKISNDKFTKIKETMMNIKPFKNIDKIKQACISYNSIHE